ncbi:MAG: hypothetical protein KAU99_01055 [Thermoplasmata archaeon]|nr:hypothetical protein [Thermoplasmata archaeon]
MRGSLANLWCLSAVFLLLAAGASTPEWPEEEDFTDASDLVALSEGDWFSYDASVNMASPDLTYVGSGYLTMSVSAIETTTVAGITYDLYNITLNGDIPGAGYIAYQGYTVDFELNTMLISGYILMERGDLSLVRADITIDADGRARPLLFWNPLRIDAVLAGNADPPAELFDFPIFVGDAWHVSSSTVLSGSVHIVLESLIVPIDITEPINLPLPFEMDVTCDERSPVTTPAGTFDSYRIVSSDGATILRYAPEVGSFVTADVSFSDVSMTMDAHVALSSYYRAPHSPTVEESLVPSIVNVGGPVIVHGHTSEPNADVRIWVPASGHEWLSVTDGSGDYNVTISAPTIPDNTPTAYDYGSHGIIVEVSSGPLTGVNISTLTVVVPDLHFTSSDLGVADILIESTTEHITVTFVSTEVVHSPFDVTFYVDDVPQQSMNLATMEAGSPRQFQVDWLTVLGSHELKVVLDPSDDVMEENELNNTLSKVVSVYPYAFPDPPEFASADITGPMLEDVALVWVPTNDNGVPIDRYEVFRSSSYDSSGMGYGMIATLSSAESQFVDQLAGEGDPSDYFYYVCARNLIDLSSCSNTQAGKFTRSVTSGIHLMSFPLVQSDESVDVVLQTVEFDRAWTYDSSGGEWMSCMKSKTYRGGFARVDHTMGFWLSVTEDSNLTVAGIVPAQTIVHLGEGWNLVGFPSFSKSVSVADLKAGLAIARAEGLDPLSPPHFLKVLSDSHILIAGESVWIRAEQETTWTVTNA